MYSSTNTLELMWLVSHMNSKVSFRVYLLLLSWGNLRFGLFVTQTYLTKALSVDWHKVLIFREGHKKSLKNHKKIYYVA